VQNENIVSDVIQIQNVATTAYSDGSSPAQSGGRQGDAMVSETHGKWYTAGYRGVTFIASTLIAGTIIPISTATAATFGLYNPLGSGKNVELIAYDLAFTGATLVVGTLEFAVLTGVGAGVALPTSITALAPLTNPIGGPGTNPVSTAFSAATVVASTKLINLGVNIGTTTEEAGPQVIHLDFDGRIILAPGTIIHVTGNAAQTTAAVQQLIWAEWPV
jgi:hypothetical protein